MKLETAFTNRMDRVKRVFENASIGPHKIEFTASMLAPDALDRLHAEFPSGDGSTIFLYQLYAVSDDDLLSLNIREAFRRERKSNTSKMSRDNVVHPESNTLYVGTSENLHARFRTHLGRGTGKTTWALYLSSWAAELETAFIVEYYEFKQGVSEDVELLEGVLWDSLQPLFGKKGGK